MNSERAWLVFAIVAGVGIALQTLAPPDLSSVPESSFDTAPRGNAALFDLLARFDKTPGRWLSGLSMPPENDTIWWISPGDGCESPEANSGAEEEPSPVSPFQVSVRPWIEAGGTALVWLPHPPLPGAAGNSEDDVLGMPAEGQDGQEEERVDLGEEADAESTRAEMERGFAEHRALIKNGRSELCAGLLGFALPDRFQLGLEGGAPPEEGRYSPIVFSVGRAVTELDSFDYAGARTLPGPTLAVFDREGDGWESWSPLWVEANSQAPIALHRPLGQGQLIVLADARMVSNARLAKVDSAPFVVDWVAEFGRPWIDEHAHGVVAETGTFRYLLTSPAWAGCLGIVVLALLFVWRGQAWPVRRVDEADSDAPTLGRFVDSVARLYGQSRDHQAVFERYREVCLSRVRRALGLSPGTSNEIILASLRARGENWPALRDAGLAHFLTREIPIFSAQDLDRHAARLDDLVRVVRVVQKSGHASRAR